MCIYICIHTFTYIYIYICIQPGNFWLHISRQTHFGPFSMPRLQNQLAIVVVAGEEAENHIQGPKELGAARLGGQAAGNGREWGCWDYHSYLLWIIRSLPTEHQ